MTMSALPQLQLIYHKDKLIQAFWCAKNRVRKRQFRLTSVSHLVSVSLWCRLCIYRNWGRNRRMLGSSSTYYKHCPFLSPVIHVLSHWINGRYCFLLHTFTILHFIKCVSSDAFAVCDFPSHWAQHIIVKKHTAYVPTTVIELHIYVQKSTPNVDTVNWSHKEGSLLSWEFNQRILGSYCTMSSIFKSAIATSSRAHEVRMNVLDIVPIVACMMLYHL